MASIARPAIDKKLAYRDCISSFFMEARFKGAQQMNRLEAGSFIDHGVLVFCAIAIETMSWPRTNRRADHRKKKEYPFKLNLRDVFA